MFIIAESVLVCCGKPVPSSADFRALDDELTSVQPKDLSLSEFSKSPIFLRLFNQEDRSFFNEMARQPAMPYVSAAGIAALQSKYPEDAYPAAMASLAIAERPYEDAWGYVVSYLQSSPPQKSDIFIPEFESLLAKEFKIKTGLVVLVQALPIASLEEWLKSPQSLRNAANESVVVSRLFGQYKSKPDWLKEKLNSYKDRSGSPLATYLYYADITNTQIKPLLLKALQDKTLEDWEITAIVRKHKDFIASDIDLETLTADAGCIRLIRQLIDTKK
jgi:hypothetical protein